MTPEKPQTGSLYIVATPIGNLGDITIRAIETLKRVDLIAAEDTRHTKKLLNHHEISTPLISCHEHNEADRVHQILEKLKSGKNIAIVSNAGTPTVSDPGFRVMQQAIAEGIRVIPIPGASAIISALCASGLPTDQFVFFGFLSSKSAKREHQLRSLANERSTLIFYESPRRILQTLEKMKEIFGDRPVVLAREITKTFEEFKRGRISEIIEALQVQESIKGEITLLVGGDISDHSISEEALELLISAELEKQEHGASAIAKKLAEATGLPKNSIYEKITKIKMMKP